VEELVLPTAPDAGGDHFDVFQNYEIEADRRDELRAYLSARRIGTIIQWGGKPVHAFSGLGFKVELPVTERFFERCLMLPLNMMLTDDEVTHIATTVRSFYSGLA
jgi:dTDP-4-amino-4,6-dideoxygalactose transaminase